METYPDYPERSEVLRDRIDDMFEAAGTSAWSEHAAAFVGALRADGPTTSETKSDDDPRCRPRRPVDPALDQPAGLDRPA